MKSKTITLISLAILATLVIGALTLNAFSAPPRLRAKAYFKPNYYDISNPVPQPWLVWLHFAGSVDASEIDPSTILLEGTYSPISAPYNLPNKQGSWIVVPFDGYDVLTAALTKLGHMTPGPGESAWVYLTVTGALYDGRTFDTGMSGAVGIIDPEISPP